MIRGDCPARPVTHRLRGGVALILTIVAAFLGPACGGDRSSAPQPAALDRPRTSILLVTLDTTRADAIGPEAGIDTPAFNALATRGLRFRHAYATAPETLPSHSSMMTGLYPAGHGVHENGRPLGPDHEVLAERLQKAGYATAAFVSSFVLARRFGLARGFDVYDDTMPDGRAERSSLETTDRAVAYLERQASRPLLLWVHYFDPHAPYEPPGAFAAQFAARPYFGEVAAMDLQLGRLLEAFDRLVAPPGAVLVVSDHGEGLGDHGESQHGHLLYQSTMRVPMVIAGPGVPPGVSEAPVSTRRVYHTVLGWAGINPAPRTDTDRSPPRTDTDRSPPRTNTDRSSPRTDADRSPPRTDADRSPPRTNTDEHGLGQGALDDVVLGEAMKPFLEYGWQPQIMAVQGTQKVIFAGTNEVYDLDTDPGEKANLGTGANLSPALRKVLDDYPVPEHDQTRASEMLSEDARRRLASLGYVSATAPPVVRPDAPRPADMVHLFDDIERASALFVREDYARAVPLLQRLLAADPHNLDAALRLATSYSMLGQDAQALAMFRRAAAIAPRSPDVRLYLGLHYARGEHWARAIPLLEPIVAETPERLPAVEALSVMREQQGRFDEALALRERVYALRDPSAAELVGLGQLAMNAQKTAAAIAAFERARRAQGPEFANDLELGVLYMASHRFADARDALDRVPPSHPEYPMALFKRAQVSVLLKEPDRAARIARARERADGTTRPLIEKEGLFKE
ncbi:MAG TPA: sulfatase-like hydrolase/transferase [Vicinamibacterales bacterium]|nr:sulfatase-like hydrolase/transferase [Vicinamibacterales bacterium]